MKDAIRLAAFSALAALSLHCTRYEYSSWSDPPTLNTPPTAQTVQTIPPPAPPPPATPAPPAPAPGPVSINGDFRVRPEPGPGGVLILERGQPVVVNAAAIRDSNPSVSLRLAVDWGDARTARVGCGPCRLDHVYESSGRFTMIATVVDLSSARSRARDGATTSTTIIRNVTVR
jgi:hypothetical protein